MKPHRNEKAAITELRRENAALRRQLAALRTERAARSGQAEHRPAENTQQGHVHALLRACGRQAHHYGKRTYLRFLVDCFTDSSYYIWWTKLLSYVRRIRLVRTLGLILAVGFTAVQTSALFVVFSAVYLAILPFLILSSGLCLFLAVLHSRAVNRRLSADLAGRHVRILLPSRRANFTPRAMPFFFASAREMAAEPGTAVIVVSPFILSPKGFGSRRMFVTARKEAEGLYVVRKYYYFILRRRVLDALDSQLAILY